MTVAGQGQIVSQPDWLTISLTVEALNTVYDEAYNEATGKINTLKEAILKMDVEERFLKTNNMRVEPREEFVYSPEGGKSERKFLGYACIYQAEMSFAPNQDMIARVFTAIAESGVNTAVSMDFKMKEPNELLFALIEIAVQDAVFKANALAKTSGVELGGIREIIYDDCPPVFSGASREIRVMAEHAGMTDTAVFTPAGIVSRTNVNIIWSIE